MRSHPAPLRRLVLCLAAIAVGLAGAAVCAGLVTYPISDKTRIGGFPVPAYAWERSDQLGWVDFVSPLTVPIMALDCVVGFLLCGGTVYLLGPKLARLLVQRGLTASGGKGEEKLTATKSGQDRQV